MPRQWADRFGNLKTGYDKLESDHRELKTQAENWKGLQTYGDPAAIQRELDVLRAFRTVQRDERGNIQYDQATGLPLYDVRPGLEKLAEQSPAMPGRMFGALRGWTGESGESLAREFFRDLGLDPDRLADYRAVTSGELNVASSTGVIKPELLEQFSPEDQAAIKSMDREVLADFDLLTEGAQRALIAQARRDLETKKFQDDVRNWQESQAKASEELFQNDLRQAQTTYISGIRENTINSIVDGLAGQVTWSTDPNVQAVQQGVVRATLVSLLDPDFRFASAPMLQALGIPLDGVFDQALGQITHNAELQTRYETYGKHPTYARHRDDFAMGQARQAVDAGVLSAKAVLNNIALAIAQAFGGQIKARAEQVDQKLVQARSRPVLNGTATTTETTAPTEKRGKPFSKERWDSRGIGG